MQVHARARLTPKGRALVVERVLKEGWSARAAAEAAGVAERTVYRWIARYRSEGEGGLLDRSLCPRTRFPTGRPRERVAAILALRRLRMTSTEIAELLTMPLSTVSVVLKREGLGKLSRLEPPSPPIATSETQPGELIHIDVKKLGRILRPGHRVTGNRRGQAGTRRNGKDVPPCRLGVRPRRHRRPLSPGLRRGPCRRARRDRSRLPAPRGCLLRLSRDLSSEGDDRQRFAPTSPRFTLSLVGSSACAISAPSPTVLATNGKAERFIQTMLREWAYAAGVSHQRRAHQGAAFLARALQLAKTTRQPWPPAARVSG